MQVTRLVREAVGGSEFSRREFHAALRAFDGAELVTTIVGGGPRMRADLRRVLVSAFEGNPAWGRVTLEQTHARVTGRKPRDASSMTGFLETLYDSAANIVVGARVVDLTPVRLGFTDKAAFVHALSRSAVKIREALNQLTWRLPEQAVFVLDADRWAPTRGKRGTGDTLSDLVASYTHNPGSVRFVISGTDADFVVPRRVNGHAHGAIELFLRAVR